MMRNRVLLARYNPKWLMTNADAICGCGVTFDPGETVLLYPNPEYDDDNIRDMVCMTCHFWFVHEVMKECS